MASPIPNETPLEKVIRIVGGVANLAKELKVTTVTIYQWKRRGIPTYPAGHEDGPPYALILERLSEKYGMRIDRCELAPNMYPPRDYRERRRRAA